jgi:hypothetical protein
MREINPMATDGSELTPQICQARAEESRTFSRQANIQTVRVMLQHVAETWDRIAEKLVHPE